MRVLRTRCDNNIANNVSCQISVDREDAVQRFTESYILPVN